MKRWHAIVVLTIATCFAWAQQAQVIEEVRIEGNERISSIAIESVMRLQVGVAYTAQLDAQDEAQIRSLGFFSLVDVAFQDGVLLVQVAEYPIIREISFVGNTAISSERLTEIVTEIQPLGTIFVATRQGEIANAIQAEYASQTIDAQVDLVSPDPNSPGTLSIVIIEPIVETLTIGGQTPDGSPTELRVGSTILRRIVKTREGDVFSIDRWNRDLSELLGTGWFEDYEVRSRFLPDPLGALELDLRLVPTRTGQISAGVALDPQSTLVGTLSYNDSNFLGRGENVAVFLSQATASGGPSAELSYGNRYLDDADTSLSARLYSRVSYNFVGSGFSAIGSDTDERFNQRRTGLSVTVGRPAGEFNRVSVGLRAERLSTISSSDEVDDTFLQQDGDVVALSLSADRDTRLPRLEAHSGDYIRVSAEPGFADIRRLGGGLADATELLGQNTFVKLGLEYRRFFSAPVSPETPFDAPRPVLAVRTELGHLAGTAPFFEQFFLGGSNSHRAFQNQRFWGKNTALASVEYRYPIQRTFTIVGFVDYGSAWGGFGELEGFSQSSEPNFRLGYGAGVSFRTPLGPIRIDFGFGGDRPQTHFSFGTSF